MSELAASRSTRLLQTPLPFAILLQMAMTTLIVVFVGTHAWDDGAITLAFSRTFAETGRIALTAASEQVEGFSSVSWFLLNALIAVFRPGFAGAILFAQILAAGFLAIATLFLFLIARALALKDVTVAAILIIFSVFGPAISEISNGMEMTLLAASGLAIVYALYFRFNWLLLVLSIVVFLTTRFEAMVYFAGLLVPLLYVQRFRAFILLVAFGIAVVGVQEAARYVVFGDLLPNTIYAKMHVPYSEFGLSAIRSRLHAVFEIVWVFWPLVVAILALAMSQQRNVFSRIRALRTNLDKIAIVAAPIVVVEVFSLLIGANLGYSGRMQFLALPFALLLLGQLFEHFASSREIILSRAFLIAVSILTIFSSWGLSAAEPVYQIKGAFVPGENFTGRGITPAKYRLTGLAVEHLATLLRLPIVTFVTPDVGGVSLCCDRIRVVDIALLTNRRLAKEGYAALPAQLADRPDVVGVHAVWAQFSKIYKLAAFNENYQSVFIDSRKLYLRNKHVQKLIEQRKAYWCPIIDSSCLAMALGGGKSDDVAFLAKGKFLVVN